MKTFHLTDEHIKLLSHMFTSWEDAEFGAPSIDPKRPYGNSNVVDDMREILGIEPDKCPECGYVLNANGPSDSDLDTLHRELETALQVVLRTVSFVPGTYVTEDYSRDWRIVK